ncbi:class I lanthipeptide [Lewinella sp. W8]|uniref:class I lanthipeptide n=1 Tax=Lewinella sp. W8 TaxID=2528208 RepID=UPI0010686991|nr:class I lanthipeptide [Lewinella sp. W8]MTB50735.1 hypothetical protein [Lewinella sp. W8]
MEKKQLQLDKQVVRRLQKDQMAQLAGGNETDSLMSGCVTISPTIGLEAGGGGTKEPDEPLSCCRKSC